MSHVVSDPRPFYVRLVGWLGEHLQDWGYTLTMWSWGK